MEEKVIRNALAFWQKVDWLVEKRKLLRRIWLVTLLLVLVPWSALLIYLTWMRPEHITTQAATVYGTFCTLCTAAEVIYNYQRGKDDAH